REIQVAHNKEHGITATTVSKRISDMSDFINTGSKLPARKAAKAKREAEIASLSTDELHKKIAALEEEMLASAEELRFEKAAELRDEIKDLHARLG
ncbi:MAG TPA: UvrB/UvrC motif-containing protein, partial [Solirubrobacterales bacterium]|nr:UvrB/UvrC motif-containing protein [Solirubrobacterales bacterium]